jgi:hypothetical protein
MWCVCVRSSDIKEEYGLSMFENRVFEEILDVRIRKRWEAHGTV